MKYRYPRYIDDFIPDTDFYHGKVPYRKGVISRQIVKADRDEKKATDNTCATYKHAPDMAFFNGKYYIQYLCTPKDEHAGAGFSVLCESSDGLHYTNFRKSFEEYIIPKCTVTDKDGNKHVFDGKTTAVMHQRSCFYRSSQNVMLILGFYGYSPEKWVTPWDRNGIGRVVREIKKDGSLSPVYFIKVCKNAGWNNSLLNYPLYTESGDKAFVDACSELLKNPLKLQEWAEENGDEDENIIIKHGPREKLQAFCSYHVDDNTVVGLWKHSMVTVSYDNAKSFAPPKMEHSLVMSGQKIWAQKISDKKWGMVYVPSLESVRRWPLCMTTSDDGFDFKNMQLIHGEVPMMRYKGFWKDEGPQYVRGISEDSYGFPDDSPDSQYMFITYSVNKEDIWVSRIAVNEPDNAINMYVPAEADAECTDNKIMFYDMSATDYVKAVKVRKPQKVLTEKIRLSVYTGGSSKESKSVFTELKNAKHETAVRIVFTSSGDVLLRTTAYICIGHYRQEYPVEIEITADCNTFTSDICIKNSDEIIIKKARFMRAVNEISETEIRTGDERSNADPNHDPEKNEDMNLEELPLKGAYIQGTADFI